MGKSVKQNRKRYPGGQRAHGDEGARWRNQKGRNVYKNPMWNSVTLKTNQQTFKWHVDYIKESVLFVTLSLFILLPDMIPRTIHSPVYDRLFFFFHFHTESATGQQPTWEKLFNI